MLECFSENMELADSAQIEDVVKQKSAPSLQR
jgi:hypothetical protein